MSNLDEEKVKAMLHLIVESMYTMMDRNMYRDSVVSELHTRIRQTDLSTLSESDVRVDAYSDEACIGSPYGHNKVRALDKNNKTLNYHICGYCGVTL
jgi:hypothetical protein